MTFLELVRALQFESGAGNAPIGTVVGQVGESKRLVDWIRQANYRIQTMYVDWKFLRSELLPTFLTGIGERDYAPPDDLNWWNKKSFKLDDNILTVDEYRPEFYPDFAVPTGRPSRATVLDNNFLRFNAIPDAAYLVEAEYFIRPVDLDPDLVDANLQISLIPEQFHWLLVYEGLRYYANYENSQDAKTQALEGIELWMPRLEAHQLRGSQPGSIADGNEIVIRAV